MRHKCASFGRQGRQKEASPTGHTGSPDRGLCTVWAPGTTVSRSCLSLRTRAVAWPPGDHSYGGNPKPNSSSPSNTYWPVLHAFLLEMPRVGYASQTQWDSIQEKVSVRPLSLNEILGMMFGLGRNATLDMMSSFEQGESFRAPQKKYQGSKEVPRK